MVRWPDRVQQRSRVVGFVIAVVYKYADDQGGYLAALITYYAVVATFPRLLLLTTVLGVVLAGHPVLQQQVLHSAMHQFPVIGDQLAQPHQLSGGAVAVVVGIAGALYGAMGGGQAVQDAMDSVWAVPRNVRPAPCGLGCEAWCCCWHSAAQPSRRPFCPASRLPPTRSGSSAPQPS